MSETQRVSQEFYCGECVGYFFVRLNMVVNHEALIRCPNCAHEHRRCINNGVIYEDGRYQSDIKETVLTMKSTYHKVPITDQMKKAAEGKSWQDRRNGIQMSPDQMLRWYEVSQREKLGDMFDD